MQNKKIAILCVGNPLRGDDGAGMAFAYALFNGALKTKDATNLLKTYSFETNLNSFCIETNLMVFCGYDTPENEIFKIKEFAPDVVIIVDAAVDKDANLRSEFITLEAACEYNFSTHNIPLYILASYLKESCEHLFLLAIFVNEQNMMQIGANLSDEAIEATKTALMKLKNILSI